MRLPRHLIVTTLFFLLVMLTTATARGAEGDLLWVKQAGGPALESPSDITVLGDGTTLMAGSFGHPHSDEAYTSTFGAGEPNQIVLTSAGYADIFVAKYNTDGTVAWARRAGGAASDGGRGIAALSDGGALVIGSFGHSNDGGGYTATFGPGEPNETVLTTSGYADIFLARYNADGSLAWVRRAGGPGQDNGDSIAAFPDGSSLVAGNFYSASATLGPGEPNETTLTSDGGGDAFLAKYNSDGSLAWAERVVGGSGDIIGISIAALSDGSVLSSGSFNDTAVFGAGEPNETTLTPGDVSISLFVAKYNADATLAWAKGVGGDSTCSATNIAALSDGGALITNSYHGTIVFGPGEANETTLPSGHDLFIAKYNPDGTVAWAKGASTPDDGTSGGAAIAALADGSALVTGNYAGPTVFGQGEEHETTLPPPAGDRDIFLAKYNSDGSVAWVGRAGGGEYVDTGIGIAALSEDSAVVAGHFGLWPVEGEGGGIAIFGPGELNETTLTSAGNSDIFIAKYSILPSPRLDVIDPPSASLGETADVDVLGASTHFDLTSEVDFGPGTLVNDVIVHNAAELTANVSISWDAAPGPRDVTVTTGEEVAVGYGFFTILGEGYVPPPTGLTATTGASSIFLEWEPSDGYYVTWYNVYRDIAVDGSYETKLNGSPVTDASYEDSDVTPGGTYYYKVTAVTDDPYESEKSEPAWATVGQIVITMPDIRGDAGESVRLPINLDAAWGVNGSGMEIHVTYDTSLLTPTALEKTVLTEGFTFVDNMDIADGQIDIAGVGGGSMVGEGHILDILFEVDPDAVLDDTGTFIFVEVVMYDWELTELDVDYSDTATFTVSSYYVLGDVTGDGVVDVADAILAQRIADGEIEPTALQLLAGDINGDGVIDSADVTLILRLVLGLPINPDGGTPKGETVQAAQSVTPPDAAGGTPRVVSIGNASGQHGETESVAVSINDASDVAGCDLTITFDPTAFEVTDVAVSTLTTDFSIQWHQSGGVLTISLASGTPISSGSGNLCTISLRVRDGAIVGGTVLNLASVKLSGEHGEDLSWEAEVSKSSGTFTVFAAAVPAASGLVLIGLGVVLAAIGTRKRKR